MDRFSSFSPLRKIINQLFSSGNSSLMKVSLMCEWEPGESFLLRSLSVCSLWLCWVGSISWEKNWNWESQLQLSQPAAAELRSVRNTLKLLTTRVYLQDSAGNCENSKNSEQLVDLLQLQLFRLRKQRIMGNIQGDNTLIQFVFTWKHFTRRPTVNRVWLQGALLLSDSVSFI